MSDYFVSTSVKVLIPISTSLFRKTLEGARHYRRDYPLEEGNYGDCARRFIGTGWSLVAELLDPGHGLPSTTKPP